MKRGLTSRVCVRVASPFDSGISMGLSVPAYYSFSGTASFRLSDYGETSSSSSSRNSIPTVHISGD